MKGTGGASFSPLRTLTRAEGVALASRIHDLHANGRETISAGSPWYQPYVRYARAQGILTRDLSAAELSAPLTRAEFATFLARSRPAAPCPPSTRWSAFPIWPRATSTAPRSISSTGPVFLPGRTPAAPSAPTAPLPGRKPPRWRFV